MWNAEELYFMPTKVLRPQWDVNVVWFEGFVWKILSDWLFLLTEEEAWNNVEAISPSTAREIIALSWNKWTETWNRPFFNIVFEDDLFLDQQHIDYGDKFKSTGEDLANTLDLGGIIQAINSWEPIILELLSDPHNPGRWMRS